MTRSSNRAPTERGLSERQSSRVLLLGPADTASELVSALERLGATAVRVAEYTDPDAVGALVDEHRADYVIAVSNDVPAAVLSAAAARDAVEVFPTPRAIQLGVDREGLRKLAGDELGLPTVPFWFASSPEELTAVAGHAGFPLVVTPLTGSVTHGQSVLTRPEDVESAWKRAFPAGPAWANRVMAETVVDVDDQITLLTVRTSGPAGPAVQFCEPIGHRRADGAPLETWQPHQLSPAALDAARSIAARIVHALGGRGVFAVDLLVRGDEVYFGSVRPGPLDLGLITLRSQRLSQYELHARAILGLAVDTIMISPAAAEIGTAEAPAARVLVEALTVPESDVRLLDGVSIAVATAPDVVRARDRAHRVSTVLHGLGS